MKAQKNSITLKRAAALESSGLTAACEPAKLRGHGRVPSTAQLSRESCQHCLDASGAVERGPELSWTALIVPCLTEALRLYRRG